MQSSLICAGITLFSVYLSYYFKEAFIFSGTAAVCLLLAGITLYFTNTYKKYIFTVFVITAGFALGALCSFNIYIQKELSFTSIPVKKITEFTGEISEDSYITNKGISIHKIRLFYIASKPEEITAEASGNVLIFDNSSNIFYSGEIVRVLGSLFANNTDPGIDFNSDINSIYSLGFRSGIYSLRSEIRKKIEKQIETFGYPASSVFKGLFLGLKSTIPDFLYNNFKETGSLHLLAISGLHVGIIYIFILLLVSPVPWKSLRWILGCTGIILYLFIVGPKPSLIRATLMLIILGIAKQLDRETDLLNILSLSLIIFLIIDPFAAFDISFQLSFLAIAGILVPGKVIARHFSPYIPKFISIPLACSIGAQIFTLPVILNEFGIFYPAGILVSLLLIPLITVFLWAGIINLILINITVMLPGMKYIFKGIYSIICFITEPAAHCPGISLKWSNEYFFFYILVFILIFIYKYKIHENKL